MFSLSLLAAVTGALLSAQAPAPTLQDILERHLESRGGREAITSLRSARLRGRMSMGEGHGAEVPFLKEWIRPDKIRTEFSVEDERGVQAFDGKQAWVHLPFMGNPDPQLLPEDQTEAFRQQVDFDGPLVDYEQKGHKVELVGQTELEGSMTWELKLTLASGDIIHKYLDSETYVEVRQVGRFEERGQEVELVTTSSDYKWVEGLRFPFTIRTVIPQRPGAGQNLIIEKVELDVELDPSRFAFPGPQPAVANE